MSEFYPCYSLPSDLYPWWIKSGYGGNSPCILGSPTYQYGCTLSNCVGWAWGRYQQARGSVDWRLPAVNAGSWYAAAIANGMSVGSEPALGAVLCLGGGHVAIVEEIAADGSFINCSESDWGGAAFSFRTRYRSRNWELNVGGFQGFIYNSEWDPSPDPPVPPEPEPPGPEPGPGNRFKWWMPRRLLLNRRNGKS